MAVGGNIIGFALQLDDNMSPVLDRVEASYNRVTRSIDNMNRAVQKRGADAFSSMQQLTSSLENLPARMSRAASRLLTTVNTAVRKVGSAGGRGAGGGSSRDIAAVVQHAVEKAMNKMTLRLTAALPREKKDKFFHTRNLREIYRRTPQPPDYVGGMQAYASGGIVGGGITGRDSVPAMLTPGELVIPADLTMRFASLLGRGGRKGASGRTQYAEGGIVGSLTGAFAESLTAMTRAGKGLIAAFTGQIADLRKVILPVWPWEKIANVWMEATFPAGGVISNLMLDELKNVSGGVGKIATGILGIRGITGVINNLTRLTGGYLSIFSKITGTLGFIKAKLGLTSEQSLIPGATKALLAASFAAAAWIDKDWTKVRVNISQMPGVFDTVKKAGMDAMVKFGLATDDMITLTTKLADEQKLMGKELEDTLEVVTQYSLDNMDLAMQVADLTLDFKMLGIAIDKQKKMFSGLILIGQETRLTLQEIANGAQTAMDGLAQITLKGGDADSAMVNLSATAGVLKNNYIDSAKAFEVWNAAMDPSRVSQTAGLMSFLAVQTGKTEMQIRSMMEQDPSSFWITFDQALRNVDTTRIGVMEQLMAMMGEAGVDPQLITTFKLMQKTKGPEAFAQEVRDMVESSRAAAEAGRLMRERWDEYAGAIGVAWAKVKNAFLAILMQIGEPVLEAFRPIFKGIVWMLQGIALVLNGLSYPVRAIGALIIGVVALAGPFMTLISLIGSAVLFIRSWSMLTGLLASSATFASAFVTNLFSGLASGSGILATISKRLIGASFATQTWFITLRDNPLRAIWILTKALTVEIWKKTYATLKAAVADLYAAASSKILALGMNATTKAFSMATLAARLWGITMAIISAPVVVIAAKIILIAALLAALGAVFYDLYSTKGRGLSDFFWNLQEALGNMSNYVRKNWGDIGLVIGAVIDVLRQAAAWWSGFFAAIWKYGDEFWRAFEPLWTDVKLAVQAAFASLAEAFGIMNTGTESAVDLSHSFEWVADMLWVIGKVVGYVVYAIGGFVAALVWLGAQWFKVMKFFYYDLPMLGAKVATFFVQLGVRWFKFFFVDIPAMFNKVYTFFANFYTNIAKFLWNLIPQEWKDWVYDMLTAPFVNAFRWIVEKLASLAASISNMGATMEQYHIPGGGAMQSAGAALMSAVPELQDGGIVQGTPGGTIARIGESGTTEAVVPLERMSEFGIAGTDMTNVEALLSQIKDLLIASVRNGQMGKADPLAIALMRNGQLG